MADKKKLEWYKWFPRKYLTDKNVLKLTSVQDSVYRTLLDLLWIEDNLAADENEILKLCKRDVQIEDVRIVMGILKVREGYLYSPFQQNLKNDALEIYNSKVEGGLKGAKRRWGNKLRRHRSPKGKLKVLHTEVEEEVDTNKIIIKEQFEQARNKYPGIKRGAETEFENFRKHKDYKAVAPLLLGAVQRQMAHRGALKNANKFVPEWKNFKTWINNRCWEDEVPAEKKEKLF